MGDTTVTAVSPKNKVSPTALSLVGLSSSDARQEDANDDVLLYQLSVRVDEEEESFPHEQSQTSQGFLEKWKQHAENRSKTQSESRRKKAKHIQQLDTLKRRQSRLKKVGFKTKMLGNMKRTSIFSADSDELIFEDNDDEVKKDGCLTTTKKVVMKKVEGITAWGKRTAMRFPIILALGAYAAVAGGRLLFLYDWLSDCYVTAMLYDRMIEEQQAVANGTSHCIQIVTNATVSANATLSDSSTNYLEGRGGQGEDLDSEILACMKDHAPSVGGMPLFYPSLLFLCLPYVACWFGLIAYHQNEIAADATRRGVEASLSAKLNSLLYHLVTGLPSLVLRDIYVCIYCIFEVPCFTCTALSYTHTHTQLCINFYKLQGL
jgi:hypothetical protein